MRQSESVRATDAGLFCASIDFFWTQKHREAGAKIDQSQGATFGYRRTARLHIARMSQHGKRGPELRRQSGCQQKPHCSAAGTGWQETRDSDQTESFGEFAFTARSASQVPDKTEQIKASTSESKLAV